MGNQKSSKRVFIKEMRLIDRKRRGRFLVVKVTLCTFVMSRSDL